MTPLSVCKNWCPYSGGHPRTAHGPTEQEDNELGGLQVSREVM